MANAKGTQKGNPGSRRANHRSSWRKQRLTFGQWTADKLTTVAGSWGFIIGFVIFLIVWVALNTTLIVLGIWDPYPYILLNLFLSCLAAIQAPVILMSQNRAAERDRRQATKDYYINRKAEKEIKMLQMQLLELKQMISKQSMAKETGRIENEIKAIQQELEAISRTQQFE